MEKAVKNLQNNKKSSDVVVQPTQNPDDVIDLKEIILGFGWQMEDDISGYAHRGVAGRIISYFSCEAILSGGCIHFYHK